MPSDSRNPTIAKATGLIFCCSMLFQSEGCFLPYCCTITAFFVDLPVPSFVSHSSFLTAKSVDFVVGMSFTMEIIHNFLFKQLLIYILLYDGLNILYSEFFSWTKLLAKIKLWDT